MEQQIVIVTGAPGSGKTTLAVKLCSALQLPLLSKDFIKESIWDAMAPPNGDRDWSRRISGAAMEVLWTLARHSPRVILEANFRPHSIYEQERLAALAARVVEIHCWCPPAEAMRRFAERAASATHHAAHVAPTLDPKLLAEYDQPMGAGSVIRVDTTLPVDLASLGREISATLANGASFSGGSS